MVTVTAAVPSATAVTKPSASTAATFSLSLDQLTLVSVASAGSTVAVSCSVAPTGIVMFSVSSVTPVTGTVVSSSPLSLSSPGGSAGQAANNSAAAVTTIINTIHILPFYCCLDIAFSPTQKNPKGYAD